MNINGVHIFSAQTEASTKAVRGIAGALVDAMPPIVTQFLYNTFNGGYIATQQSENRWVVRTYLQHIEMVIEAPRRARLLVWGRRLDRKVYMPAINRVIQCQKE